MSLLNISRRRILRAIGCLLVIPASLWAQKASPAPISAPYAGATISDFKGRVELKAQTQGLLLPPAGCR